MASYQRFQTLSSGTQNLFDPDSPVWVSRYRLSLDLESGKRLLQLRLVNRSDKKISRVFLRIKCFEATTRKATVLELVPMPAVLALPGRAFGERSLVEITPPQTSFVEAFAQRVVFSDGTAWDESSTRNYLAFAEPVPVRTDDPDYGLLKERALQGGVRNSYRFHTQKGVWTCTCGQPNSGASLRCDHCGADRLWLEKNMDPDYREPAPTPAPEPVQQPAPAPQPAPVVVPILPAPQAPQINPYPIAPVVITRPSPRPEPEEEEPRRGHPGRVIAVILAIVLLLGGAWCAWRYLRPYLRYKDAVEELNAGNYEEAQRIFEDLGDYRDSPERITQAQLQKIRDVMKDGNYAQALEMLQAVKDLPGADELTADCVYSLGVVAFNGGDLDAAWTYVRRLEEEYPNYESLPRLRTFCYYNSGNRKANEAASLEDAEARILAYEDAIYQFSMAEGYGDSAERMKECSYRIGIEQMNMGELTLAVDTFTTLGDYKSSQQYKSDCMFRYAQLHVRDTDQTTMDYLDELAEAGYDGAEELRDRYNGVGFDFRLIASQEGGEQGLTEQSEISDLTEIGIRYAVEPTDENGAVLVLVRYTLPDGRQGRGVLNSDGSASGMKRWKELNFPTACTSTGTVRVEFFDSARGETEALQTVSFQYVHQESIPEEDPVDPQTPTE